MTIEIIILSIVAVVLLFFAIKQTRKVKNVKEELDEYVERYKGIINVDQAIATKNDELKSTTDKIETLREEFDHKKEALNQDYVGKRSIYEGLLAEIAVVEENLEDISYGLYKPHFDYATSEEYKQKLEEIWTKEKELVRSEKATSFSRDWTVNGSKSEGLKMLKHQSKLMLRAFNGECDGAISKVRWNNIGTMQERISKAVEAINKLGSTQSITITDEYKDLKLQELRLEFELQEKLHEEKEEQKKIREQMREEQKVQQEMEKARQDAEQEEARYQKALEKAKAEISKTTGVELEALYEKIKSLEDSLQKAQEQKVRAISRAQQTKSGHVYIISNIGSFGDNVYKFGMTRRLEPQDRIDELGNASVPFDFDVHGMIYAENAPELENKLHKHFNDKRINLVHLRREFFNVTMDDIEQVVNELKLNIQLTKIAEAKEYRMSQSMKEAKVKQATAETPKTVASELERFPKTLT